MSNALSSKFAHFITFVIITTIVLSLSINIDVYPVSAAAEANKWAKVTIPAEGEAGGWVLASGSDIKHLAASPDGTLWAYGAGLTYTLLKSTDGGLRWKATGSVQDAIIDITVCPNDPKIIYYATSTIVRRSTDGGKTFITLPTVPGAGTGNVEITSIAAGWLNGSVIAASTRDTDGGEYGGAYLFNDSEIVPEWTDTGIGNYDVYRAAFPPDYANFRQIIVMATDETESYVFNKVAESGWNTFFSPAVLKDSSGNALVTTVSADIVFPGVYHTTGDVNERSFYTGVNTGTGGGDVYKVTLMDTPEASTAVDLNAGSLTGTNTDITSISVNDQSGSTIILAGGANGQTFITTDGGTSWTRNKKAVTGSADAYVLIPPDFVTSRILYTATSGAGSALSVSRDLGITWNQVSLIDTAILNINEVIPSPGYSQDNTLFISTTGAGPGTTGIWRTTDNGLNWERIFSTALTGVDVISRISLPPQYGTQNQLLFAMGESGGSPAVWCSEDNGQSYRARFIHDPATGTPFSIDAWVIIDENSFFVSNYDGSNGLIYRTENRGFAFTAGAPAGANPIRSLALSPDFKNDSTIIAGNSNGGVFFSNDGGVSFTPLPAASNAGPLTGGINVAFDPDFKENRNIYVASNTPGAGIFRFNTDTGEEWKSIDGALPAGAVIDRFTLSGAGVLYGANANANGGLERCLNPRTASPAFETVTSGLSAGAILSSICVSGSRIWAIDTANCKLMAYEDTLTSPVVLASPEDNVSGIGSLTEHAVKNITLDWEPANGATGYQWQCDLDGDFASIPAGLQGTASGSSVRLPPLDPATAYRWRVRASAPALSPWSAVGTFTTSLDTQAIILKPETPVAGALGVPVRPIFQWTAVMGASSYELLTASDPDFENPVIIKINDYALPSNAWECDVSLDYATTYYWKVRAVTASTHSAWSAAGVFTTMTLPLPDAEKSREPEVRLLGSPDTMMNLSPTRNAQVFPPAATTTVIAPVSTVSAAVNQPTDIPDWVKYFIGGLLVIVMLALLIILAVVLKIRRF